MSLLTWKEYRLGKRAQKPKATTEIPTAEVGIEAPTSEVCLLNGMSVEQLQEIKGIGPKTAEKIASRQPYKRLEDLTEVVSTLTFKKVCERLSKDT